MAFLEQLIQWRDALDDDGRMRSYSRCAAQMSLGKRRESIRNVLLSILGQAAYGCKIEDAEQLRRYFDAKYSIAPKPNDPTLHKYDYLETLLEVEPKKLKKAKSIMDKNLAALLRSDAKTVQVQLPGTDGSNTGRSKTYTYVSHLALAPGDHVAVETAGRTVIGLVKHVDDEAKIEPGCETEYNWVIGKIDMAAYEANAKRNEDIVAEAAVIVRENMRRSFASQVLGAASGEQRARLLALTGNATS